MATVSREDFSCAAATNESAYRRVTVPVLRIDAGPGPAVALMAGVHGDEWEGQAAILDLWHSLPGMLQRGTVYLLPAANVEASLAGTRLSPSDGGNLNRAFLGAPARGYTESVAAALEARLLPRIQALAMNEAARMVEEGVASAEDIDLNPLLKTLQKDAQLGAPDQAVQLRTDADLRRRTHWKKIASVRVALLLRGPASRLASVREPSPSAAWMAMTARSSWPRVRCRARSCCNSRASAPHRCCARSIFR